MTLLYFDELPDGAQIGVQTSDRGLISGQAIASAISSNAMAQTTWFIDEQNVTGVASDTNNGATATTPLRTDTARRNRMGETPVWAANTAYHVRYLSDADEVVISGRREVGATIFLHGSATDGQGQSTLYAGTINAIVALSRTTNQPIEITSNGLSVDWTNPGGGSPTLIGSRLRIVTGASVGAKGWVLKQLAGKAARFCEFSVKATYSTPFTRATAAASPALNDTFVVEKLTKINKCFVNLGAGRGTIGNVVALCIESLDVGADVFSGVTTEEVVLDGSIMRSNGTTNGIWGYLSLDTCRYTVPSGSTANLPGRVFRFEATAGYCDTNTTNINPMNVGQLARYMAQTARVTCTAAPGGDIGGVSVLQLGIFDAAGNGALTVKSPQGAQFATPAQMILWGNNAGNYCLDIRPGASTLISSVGGAYTVAANFPIVGGAGDVRFGPRLSVPALDESGPTAVWTAPRLLSWANVLALVSGGGFCPTSAGLPLFIDPVSGAGFVTSQ